MGDNTFRAFLCYAFPLLEISTKVAKEFRDLTYESDQFPQYTWVCLSRLQNKIRGSIHCEICKIYEESCLREGQFSKSGKYTQKEFVGISQVEAASNPESIYLLPCTSQAQKSWIRMLVAIEV